MPYSLHAVPRDPTFITYITYITYITFITSITLFHLIGNSFAFCTVRNAKLEWTRATPGRRVRNLLCKRSKSAVSATTTRTR